MGERLFLPDKLVRRIHFELHKQLDHQRGRVIGIRLQYFFGQGIGSRKITELRLIHGALQKTRGFIRFILIGFMFMLWSMFSSTGSS